MKQDNAKTSDAHIRVRDLSVGYGDLIVQSHVNFDIQRGSVFVIIGGSGCGKSTVLRSLIGLLEPFSGDVFYSGKSFWQADSEERDEFRRRFGVMYQGGALWPGPSSGRVQ